MQLVKKVELLYTVMTVLMSTPQIYLRNIFKYLYIYIYIHICVCVFLVHYISITVMR